MRLTIFLVIITARVCCAQYNEFKVHTNGLIYDETTMNRLGTIVDSLNVKFRACDLSHPYYSILQGFATFVDIRSKEVRKLMEAGMSFEEFEKKYQRNVKQKNIWITKSRNTRYDGRNYIQYEGLPAGYGSEISIEVKNKKAN